MGDWRYSSRIIGYNNNNFLLKDIGNSEEKEVTSVQRKIQLTNEPEGI
jgi:hypothetical protein